MSEEGKGGIGMFGLLGVLFVGLKLTGHITWSWLWVLLPFLVVPIFILLILGLAMWAEMKKGGF